MKIIILKGIPACWKSTYAHRLMEESEYVWINKDDIRSKHGNIKEWAVDEIQRKMITAAVKADKDIIVDNTHCNKNTLHGVVTFCKSFTQDVEIVDCFQKMCDEGSLTMHEWLLMCIRRNAQRDKIVHQSVLHEMFLQEYECLRPIVIVDLDWTLCNIDHRLHFVKEGKKDWKSFFEWIPWDTVNRFVHATVASLHKNYQIVLCSWRPDNYCELTVKRLRDNNICYDHLLMRHSRDNRPDTIVKKEMLDKCLARNTIIWAIDDRKSVIDMRLENWIPVLAVDWWRDF